MPEGLDAFYKHSAFKSLPVLGRGPVNQNILDPKTGPPELSPKSQNGDFSKTLINILIKVQ
jgi:hypothetical protein